MADRNWSHIGSGAVFESLVSRLVFFEDPGAALFGRPGKDGGQDVRSSDGKLVYQAKHHANATADMAIADAKSEAAKIGKYRERDHSRHAQWAQVRQWCLVTNAEFNPTDRKKWDEEVVPGFQALGLTASYWERENIEALLDKHIELSNAYFCGESRILLSMREARDVVLGSEPFLDREDFGEFVGRQDEATTVGEFLQQTEKRFLLVHGAGGVGKTRFLLEVGSELAASGEWQVLWANVASMAGSSSWFESVPSSRHTLVIVDDPDDDTLLRRLLEQTNSRSWKSVQWKAVISARTPQDSVLRLLSGPKVKRRVRELKLDVFPSAEAKAMCLALLRDGPLANQGQTWHQRTAKKLSQRFHHPVWLTLAVHLLETSGDLDALPEEAKGLAGLYLDEIVERARHGSSEEIRALMSWVALVGPLNLEDDSLLTSLAQELGLSDADEVRERVHRLVERRALIRRGAYNRLVEIKSDVLRDTLLREWLTIEIGPERQMRPSHAAKRLAGKVLSAVVSGGLGALDWAALSSFARTEQLLARTGVDASLFDELVAGIQNAISRMGAKQRVSLVEVILKFAAVRPLDAVAISRQLRGSPVSPEKVEGIFGDRRVGQNDVVLELAWFVSHGAFGAQTVESKTAVLEELCELAKLEAEIAPNLERGLPNDGKRAKDLLQRTYQGGPHYWGDFEQAGRDLGLALLNELAMAPPSAGEKAVAEALVVSALGLERSSSWFEDGAFHWGRFGIAPDSDAALTRLVLRDRIRDLLGKERTPLASRRLCWHLLEEDHRRSNQLVRREAGRDPSSTDYGQETPNLPYNEVLGDLRWTKVLLESRELPIEELLAARELWSWHIDYETDPTVKEAAEELEERLRQDTAIEEFYLLLDRRRWGDRPQWAQEKAQNLCSQDDENAIDGFIQRAVTFLGEENLEPLGLVTHQLGKVFEGCPKVGRFIYQRVAEKETSLNSELAGIMVAGRVAVLREGASEQGANDPTVAFLRSVLDVAGSDVQRMRLLHRIYHTHSFHRDSPQPSGLELNLLREFQSTFIANGQTHALMDIVGWSFRHDWPRYTATVAEALEETADNDLPRALKSLIHAVHWGFDLPFEQGATIQAGFAEWLLDQLMLIPDLGDLDGSSWHLEEIFKKSGRATVAWLADALVARLERARTRGRLTDALGQRPGLGDFVEPIRGEQRDDVELQQLMSVLVGFAFGGSSIGYYLPGLLQQIDPDGVLVPTAVVVRLKSDMSIDELHCLARLAGGYVTGTAPWRRMAGPIVEQALKLEREEDRWGIFHSLKHQTIRTYSGSVGEVPEPFYSEVEDARRSLAEEESDTLKHFFRWALKLAEKDLRHEEERCKEERGE